MAINGRIALFEGEGGEALGFNTGLGAQAFAQAKLAAFITEPGALVYPGGKTEPWIPGGVLERGGLMVVWGPPFAGEGLDSLAEAPGREDEALEALAYWLRGWPLFAGEEDLPWPAGALIARGGAFPRGTILFPPRRLVKRCLEAEGEAAFREGAARWVHPELRGGEAAAFTAGALLYRILSGKAPFPREDPDLLPQDIREGVYLPAKYAAPGLREEAARLIGGALGPVQRGGPPPRSSPGGARSSAAPPAGVLPPQRPRRGLRTPGPPGSRPGPEDFAGLLGEPGGKKLAAFFRPLEAGEREALERERERIGRGREFRVNTRRFVIRNTAIITGLVIALGIAGLIAQSVISGRASLPTTRGMSPPEVIAAYYGAFGELDHQLMEACVTGKAGKEDISMVTNFFVMSRVRMAYEAGAPPYISPERWIEAGSPPGMGLVFGVSELRVEELSPPGAVSAEGSPVERRFRASYRFWLPESAASSEEGPEGASPEDPFAAGPPEPPRSLAYGHVDELVLRLVKDSWRIAELRREAGGWE